MIIALLTLLATPECPRINFADLRCDTVPIRLQIYAQVPHDCFPFVVQARPYEFPADWRAYDANIRCVLLREGDAIVVWAARLGPGFDSRLFAGKEAASPAKASPD